MKTTKNTVMIVSVAFMVAVWLFVSAQRSGFVPGELEVVIFLLIMLFGIYAFVVNMKKHKEIVAGLPVDDELSERIKFQAGYSAFMVSMFIWFGLFLVKSLVADHDTLFGLGVLAPAVIYMFTKSYLSHRYDENAD